MITINYTCDTCGTTRIREAFKGMEPVDAVYLSEINFFDAGDVLKCGGCVDKAAYELHKEE